MKNITQSLKVTVLSLLLSFGLSYVYAWTAPTVTAPGGNVSAPINTSTTSQLKDGAFGATGIIHGYSNAYFDGNMGVGTTTPAVPLHVYSSSLNGSAVAVDRLAGKAGMFQVRTNGSPRWVFGGNATAETGSNAGSDFQMISYTDSGGGLADTFFIKRSTGNVGIGTTAPATKLDVAGGIRPIAATVGAVCSPIGSQAYNSATGEPLYCSGTVWTAVSTGIGVGQTWQNVTASRALGTTYTNTTGKPIEVLISGDTGVTQSIYIYVNGVAIARLYESTNGSGFPAAVIVPAGSTYMASYGGIYTAILMWSELR